MVGGTGPLEAVAITLEVGTPAVLITTTEAPRPSAVARIRAVPFPSATGVGLKGRACGVLDARLGYDVDGTA